MYFELYIKYFFFIWRSIIRVLNYKGCDISIFINSYISIMTVDTSMTNRDFVKSYHIHIHFGDSQNYIFNKIFCFFFFFLLRSYVYHAVQNLFVNYSFIYHRILKNTELLLTLKFWEYSSLLLKKSVDITMGVSTKYSDLTRGDNRSLAVRALTLVWSARWADHVVVTWWESNSTILFFANHALCCRFSVQHLFYFFKIRTKLRLNWF